MITCEGSATARPHRRFSTRTSAKPWFEHIPMGETFKDPDQSRWAKEMRHDPLAVLDTVENNLRW